ncbi:MAG: DinB family protein [Gemmatimonadetes bacterium]|nr:DinB family protein [Gemmatimonadota bacterium]
MTVTITRPTAGEYAPYFDRYLSHVPDGNILEILTKQISETAGAVGGLSEKEAGFRYAPGKWSIREIVGHLADTERIFAYRALCFARGEQQGLPGFDENAYAAAAHTDARPLPSVLSEFEAVRAATVAFFAGLDGEELMRRGTANQWEFSVRAVPFIIAGHERHHLGVIKERYLGSTSPA